MSLGIFARGPMPMVYMMAMLTPKKTGSIMTVTCVTTTATTMLKRLAMALAD